MINQKISLNLCCQYLIEIDIRSVIELHFSVSSIVLATNNQVVNGVIYGLKMLYLIEFHEEVYAFEII